MKKIQRMSVREFLHDQSSLEESFIQKAKNHIAKNKSFYITVGSMTIFFLCTAFDQSAMAAGSTGPMDVDGKMTSVWYGLAGVGKWLIIFKAATDIVKDMLHGDMDGAKSKVWKYIIAFALLLGLPTVMGWVEDIVTDLSAPAAGAGR